MIFICNSQHHTVCKIVNIVNIKIYKTDCKFAGPHELLLHKNILLFDFFKYVFISLAYIYRGFFYLLVNIGNILYNI